MNKRYDNRINQLLRELKDTFVLDWEHAHDVEVKEEWIRAALECPLEDILILLTALKNHLGEDEYNRLIDQEIQPFLNRIEQEVIDEQ